VHRLFPFILTWDDHEFTNDCWRDVANEFDGAAGEERDTQRRMAASRAWFEYLPVDVELDLQASFPDDIRVYRSRRWGKLVHLALSDVRYFRDDHVVPEGPAEPRVGKFIQNSPLGARVFAYKDGFDGLEADAAPTMLGADQQQWLVEQLNATDAVWKLWCTPVLVAQMVLDLRDYSQLPATFRELIYFKLDQWDGFRTERGQILSALSGVDNVVVLSGDLHGNYAAELRADFDDPEASATAVELMVTGVSSITLHEQLERFARDDPLLSQTELGTVTAMFDDNLQRTSPHFKYANSKAYGYLVLDIRAQAITATFVELDEVRTPAAPSAGEVRRVRFCIDSKSNAIT